MATRPDLTCVPQQSSPAFWPTEKLFASCLWTSSVREPQNQMTWSEPQNHHTLQQHGRGPHQSETNVKTSSLFTLCFFFLMSLVFILLGGWPRPFMTLMRHFLSDTESDSALICIYGYKNISPRRDGWCYGTAAFPAKLKTKQKVLQKCIFLDFWWNKE